MARTVVFTAGCCVVANVVFSVVDCVVSTVVVFVVLLVGFPVGMAGRRGF